MSQLDRQSPYRGPADRLALVQGVVAADAPTIETDWLEVKREADLSDKSWQGELGRQILGFANRDPVRAGRVVGGYAYIVIGAEPGSVRGVEQIDPAILEDTIGRFVGRGENAPAWEPFYVSLEQASVLVIVVDPPRQGVPVAPLRATYLARGERTVPEGRLFIRRGGKTVEASATEVDQLFARMAAPTRTLAIDVASDEAPSVVSLDLSDAAVDQWVAEERTRLLLPLSVPGAAPAPMPYLLSSLAGQEQRSKEEYVAEVDNYLARVRADVPAHAAFRALAAGVGDLDLHVENRTDDNFAQVVVELLVPGEVRAYFDPEEIEPEDDLLEPPRSWGEPRKFYDPFAQIVASPFPAVRRPKLRFGHIDNSSSARIVFGAVDVRPDYRHGLGRVALIADASLAGRVIEASWHATSTSVSGVTPGTIAIAVEPRAVSIVDAMRLPRPDA